MMTKNLMLTLAMAPALMLGACSGLKPCLDTGEQGLERTAGQVIKYSNKVCDADASFSATEKKAVESNPGKMFGSKQMKK